MKRPKTGKGISTLMRKLGSAERRAIRLLSEAIDVPLPIRKRAQIVLLAELGIKAVTIATLVELPKAEVQSCLDNFKKQGMHALYES
jgi:hypothetical protein